MIFPKLFVSCTEIKGDNNNIKQQIDGQATTFAMMGAEGDRESLVLNMCLPIYSKGQYETLKASILRGNLK